MPATLLRLDRRRRLALLLALVAVMLGVTAFMIAGIRSFDASSRWVTHTHEVLAQIEAVRSALDGTESAARGYRLSGDEDLEAEYVDHRPQPLQQVDALARLVADNPVQVRRAALLRRLVRDRLAQIEATVDLHDRHRDGDANAVMLASGRRSNDAIDTTTEAIATTERLLLAGRQATSRRDAVMLTAIVVAGMVLSLGMLALLLAMVGREARRAQRLEQDARQALTTLEASTAQREHLAEQRRLLSAFAGLLHGCHSTGEALEVAGNALAQLVPHGAGVCYVMRASQNQLEREALFGTHGVEYAEVMRPDQCWGLRRGHPHVYDPQRPTACCEHLHDLPPDLACGICVPLVTQGNVLGLLHVTGRLGETLGAPERDAVEAVAEHLAVVLYSLELRESLRVQSLRDPLTGLYNRRYLEESLPREIERCERRGRPLSVLMLDVDYFKRFNDEHGHGAGDVLLGRIGQVLASVTRGEDIACRFGGEEFTIVMPEASLDQAIARAEQIREAIADASVTYMRRELGPVTASIGVGELRVGTDSPETLLAAADRALYAAKAQGRNRVLAVPGPGARDAAMPRAARA